MISVPWRKVILIGLSAFCIILLSLTSPGFRSPSSMQVFFQEISITILLASALSVVFISGIIDFSLGGFYLLALALVRLWRKTDWAIEGGLALQISAALVIPAAMGVLGALVGFLVSLRHRYSALMTLGFALLFGSLGLLFMPDFGPWCEPWFCTEIFLPPYLIISASILFGIVVSVATIYYFLPEFHWIRPVSLTWLMIALASFVVYEFNGLPLVVLIACLLVILGEVYLEQTRWGLSIRAAGSNREAARWTGVPLTKVSIWVFAALGLLVGIAALFEVDSIAREEAGAVYIRQIDAFVAMLLGGVAYTGGKGRLAGVALAALFVASINQLEWLGLSVLWLIVIKALLILLSLWFEPLGYRLFKLSRKV